MDKKCLGPRVCGTLQEMEHAVYRLLHAAKIMCRTHQKEVAQLQTHGQQLQNFAVAVEEAAAQLDTFLPEIEEVSAIAARIEAADASISAAKGKVFEELAANAKLEQKMRNLVAKVRRSESGGADVIGIQNSDSTTAPVPVRVDDLLQYSRRIGASTSLQPNQPAALYPDVAEMKQSILHHPEQFAVKKRRAPASSSSSSSSSSSGKQHHSENGSLEENFDGLKVPRLDSDDYDSRDGSRNSDTSTSSAPTIPKVNRAVSCDWVLSVSQRASHCGG